MEGGGEGVEGSGVQVGGTYYEVERNEGGKGRGVMGSKLQEERGGEGSFWKGWGRLVV